MPNLIAQLAFRIPASLDLVVHVGPGEFALPSDYSHFNGSHFVLIEGDPDIATLLKLRFGRSRRFSIVSKHVSSIEAQMPFYRYNCSSLNGPFEIDSLRHLYPSLKPIDSFPVVSDTLANLLSIYDIPLNSSRLLILDVPGQDAAILQSLDKSFLTSFNFVFVAGCRAPLPHASLPIDDSVALLSSLHYQIIGQEHTDSQLPHILFYFSQQHSDLHSELHKRSVLLAQKSSVLYSLEQEILTCKTKLALAEEQIAIAMNQLHYAEPS